MDTFVRKWDFFDHFAIIFYLCFLYTSDTDVGMHFYGTLEETSVFLDVEIAISLLFLKLKINSVKSGFCKRYKCHRSKL